MASRTTRRILELILLPIALAGCNPPAHHERNLGSNGVTVEVDSPHQKVSYPDPVPLKVTFRNRGDQPYAIEWPPPFRLQPGCGGGVQQEPVELHFEGTTLAKDGSEAPYRWRWTARAPARVVLQPGESFVAMDTVFHPPPALERISGWFCPRVYGYDLPGGVTYRQPGR